jgi:hypothetical protein
MKDYRMKDALENIARRNIPEDTNLWPDISARLERKSFMQTLRARPVLLVLIFLLSIALLSGAAYAIGRSQGYIPGLGLVEQGSAIRVLDKPVSITRGGITLTVKKAILGQKNSMVVFGFEGIKREMLPGSESISGCRPDPEIHLPDGTIMHTIGGQGNPRETRVEYRLVPVEVNDMVFYLQCVTETMPGKAPKDWEITLHFIPAPADMAVNPVFEISPAPQPTDIEVAPTYDPYGITMVLEKYVPLADGYYLVGRTEWTDERLSDVSPSAWGLKAYDASGRELPLAPAIFSEDTPIRESIGPYHWIYHLYSKNFNGLVTLRTSEMSVIFKEPVRITLDLRPYNFTFSDDQVGQTWELGSLPLDVPGITATVEGVT